MPKFWRKTQAMAECLRLAVRIGGLPGGADALVDRLRALESELSSASASRRCDRCGSTELEPSVTETRSAGEVEISRFRCKACGWESR